MNKKLKLIHFEDNDSDDEEDEKMFFGDQMNKLSDTDSPFFQPSMEDSKSSLEPPSKHKRTESSSSFRNLKASNSMVDMDYDVVSRPQDLTITRIKKGISANHPVVDEVPLLEELGVDVKFMFSKSLSVINPLSSSRRKTREFIRSRIDISKLNEYVLDQDLIGPVFFALLFGTILLFKGEVHYGSIYGCGTVGCLSMWVILNLMGKENSSLSIWKTISILGYSFLPVIILAVFDLFLFWFNWNRVLHYVFAIIVILWSSVSSTEMFVANLKMFDQYYLVAYPVVLIFSTFILLTL